MAHVTAAAMGIVLLLTIGAAGAAAQEGPSRADSFRHGSFCYGTIGESLFAGPAFAFGRRVERNSLALDIVPFTVQAKIFGAAPDLHQIGGVYTDAYAASLGTVKALYLLFPGARTTPWSVARRTKVRGPDWTSDESYAWTPSAQGGYRIGVWVRSATSTSDASDNDDANGSIPFAITP